MSVIDADAHVIATEVRTTATPTTPTISRLSKYSRAPAKSAHRWRKKF